MISEKITRLQKLCAEQNIDYIFVANFGHEIADALLYYILLKNPEHAVLLIPRTGRPTLWITPFEVIQTQEQFSEIDVRPLDQKLIDAIQSVVPVSSKIGFRSATFPILAYEALIKANYSMQPIEGVEKMFAQKNTYEIETMRFVAQETDLAFDGLVKQWSEFETERDAARFLEQYVLEHDYALSFPTIIASGPHAARPHHVTSNTSLTRGFCVIDMGLRINGYCSDMTRTIFIGHPSSQEKKRYEELEKIQEETCALVKPHISTVELDAFCREKLGSKNQYFVHGLGHGVGTQVHEWPAVGTKNPILLEPGMVITIEPGLYEEGVYGMRIEDDILVTEDGNERLTRTSKNLILVTDRVAQ